MGMQAFGGNFSLGGVIETPSISAADDPSSDDCDDASGFRKWRDEFVLGKIERSIWSESPDLRIEILRAKAALHDRYYEWRKSAPKKHQRYTGAGHTCLFHIYEETCERIKKIELTKCPPDMETQKEREERTKKSEQAAKEQQERKTASKFPGLEGLDAIELGPKTA